MEGMETETDTEGERRGGETVNGWKRASDGKHVTCGVMSKKRDSGSKNSPGTLVRLQPPVGVGGLYITGFNVKVCGLLTDVTACMSSKKKERYQVCYRVFVRYLD